MAKKKKTALKPAINRGFATTSTPSKSTDRPYNGSTSSTGGTNTPSEDVKKELALAYDRLEINDRLGQQVNEGPDDVIAVGDTFDSKNSEEQALQNLIRRLQDKVDKEVARVWKNIEFDRRLSKQLPIFEIDASLREEIIQLSRQKNDITEQSNTKGVELSDLLAEISPSSAASEMLQKALVTHAILLKLGFTFHQALSALSSCTSLYDLDDCLTWLACNLSAEKLEMAERKAEGKPPLKSRSKQTAPSLNGDVEDENFDEPLDTTCPPVHEGFKFDRQRRSRFTNLQNGNGISASNSISSMSTPVELTPEIEANLKDVLTSTSSMLISLEDRETIDVLEKPIEASAHARLTIIQLDKLSSKLEKICKEVQDRSPPLLEECRRKLLNVKAQARAIIDECRDSRDWNSTLADRMFLRLKIEWEDTQGPVQKEVIETYPGHDVSKNCFMNGKDDGRIEMFEDGSQADSSEDGMFGDMLDEQANEVTDASTQTIVRLRDLPPQTIKAAGSKSPKVLLSDALRRVDPYATSRFDIVSTGGRLFRSRLTLRWSISKTESMIDTYAMTGMATSTQSSAEDILAVAALMCIEERPIYKTLASGWRDWWMELEDRRQEEKDSKSRVVYKKLIETLKIRLLEENAKAEEKKMKLKDKSEQPIIGDLNNAELRIEFDTIPTVDHAVIALWQAKKSTYQYNEMLPGRLNLPIAAFKDQILQVLLQNQVFVLSGETGCGKSTQVPSYILEDCLSRGQPCKIYVTEPRRISAISLAERVSAELGEHRGMVGKGDSLIGSAVRLESNIGRNARLIFATTGIVLRMLEGSRLDGVTHVILDEVHERSIESDFLLIILKSLLEARPDLKVILMSATLDADRISEYFGGCPTVEVPGRTFPVDVRWLEDAVEMCEYTIEDGSQYARRLKRGQEQVRGNQAGLQGREDEVIEEDEDDDGEQHNPNETSGLSNTRYNAKTISTIDRMDEYAVNHDLIIVLLEKMCYKEQALAPYSSAILIFLPGIAEIRKLNDMLQAHSIFGSNGFQLFPLHSTISTENQSLVFHLPPRGVRKIVLSTNIAETGITIPDITAVIDTGKHREMRFDEKRQLSKLVECFVAKSNAKQRRGRAGRVQNGLCWHLFTKRRHDQYLAEHPLPEMLRLSLQDLALKLKVMKIKIGTTIEDALSKALDPPTSLNIQRSISSLIEIKALTSNEDITPLGRHLAKIPLDVHMGKFLLIACSLQILDSALTIAATLNSKSPFLTPFGRELEARLAKKSFDFGDNDFLTIVRAFNSWRRATENGIGKQFCQKCFLSQTNFIQIEELRQQYLTYLLDSGFVSVEDEMKREIVGARFRYNYKNTKFLKVPAFLDVNSNSLIMINTALVSALYPKLLNIDSKTGSIRTLTNGAPAAIHPSSVNFKLRLYNLPKAINHLVYFTIMQSKKLYAWETGTVDDKSILLMCGDADFRLASKSLYIDRTRIRITFYDLKTLVSLKILREKMSKLLTTTYRNPTKPWTSEEEHSFLLACRMLGVGANDKDRALSS